jgi:hypothetical protein
MRLASFGYRPNATSKFPFLIIQATFKDCLTQKLLQLRPMKLLQQSPRWEMILPQLIRREMRPSPVRMHMDAPIRCSLLLAAQDAGSKAIEVAEAAKVEERREALDPMIEVGTIRKLTWAVGNGGTTLWKLPAYLTN